MLRRWPLLAFALVTLLVGCTSFDEQQRKWIFQPIAGQPAWAGARGGDLDEVWIEHQSAVSGNPVRLHALWLPQARADAPLLLYLHGARRNVWDSSLRIRNRHQLGFAVLASDYRGFGSSSDELPSEAAVLEDARAAWDWLARAYPINLRPSQSSFFAV